MSLTDSAVDADEARVVAAVEQLLADHPPSDTPEQEFLEAQFDAGLAWVHFPEGHGGMGVSPKLQRTVIQAISAAKGPMGGAKNPIGYGMCGPAVLTHGTDEQKELLRPLFSNEHIWCQMFSEPGAGSDVASLAMKAERDGDEWIVNGQKVWTTLAHIARYGLVICRTDPEQPKHRGITAFIVDMELPGVEVRPLRQMTGEADFNEVFFENVRVPKDSIVGERGRGWYVSRSTLKNERALIGNATFARRTFDGLQMMAQLTEVRGTPVIKDPVFRDKLVELEGHLLAAEYNGHRLLTAGGRGEDPGLPGVVTKLHTTTLGYHIGKLAMDMMSDRGCLAPGEQNAPAAGMFGTGYMWYFGMALGGGAPNIQRNVIAERGLGLPRDPRR